MARLVNFCLFALLTALWANPTLAGIPVSDVRLGLQNGGLTRFVLELDSTAADYKLFLLDNPARAVIDLPALDWPTQIAAASKGLVKGWRHGQFGSGTRIVLDLSSPASVVSAAILPPRAGSRGLRLAIDLAPAERIDPKARWGQLASAQLTLSGLRPPPLPARRQPADLRPLIVIDPGHGGVDPGAIAPDGQQEKRLTLAVARRLATRLETSGNYRVVLTRKTDRFIALRDRVKIARRLQADLFISLHADSMDNSQTRGASVYTLSDTASDAEAAALAESENRADQLAGLETVAEDDIGASILIDMSQRATLNDSRRFANYLIGELGSRIQLLPSRPHRSAGFAVLKAPDIPSVLVEMGYLSNAKDRKKLQDDRHQMQIAAGIEEAINRLFAARLSLNNPR